MGRRKGSKLLRSVMKVMRSTVAGRRKSDQVLARVLSSDSDEPTVWAQADPLPDSKTPLCHKCGAMMIHATGSRSNKKEFWACSRLDCEGTREVAE